MERWRATVDTIWPFRTQTSVNYQGALRADDKADIGKASYHPHMRGDLGELIRCNENLAERVIAGEDDIKRPKQVAQRGAETTFLYPFANLQSDYAVNVILTISLGTNRPAGLGLGGFSGVKHIDQVVAAHRQPHIGAGRRLAPISCQDMGAA